MDIIKLLYISARPKIVTERINTENDHWYYKITPTASIFFSATEFFREHVLKAAKSEDVSIIVIDFNQILTVDYTLLKVDC